MNLKFKKFAFQASLGILLPFATIQAQNTFIKGSVMDAKSGEKLEGVAILIVGSQNGVYSDSIGNFRLTTKPGTYDIKFSYVGYNDTILKEVQIKDGVNKPLVMNLNDGSLEVEGVQVTAVRVTHTETSVISDIKTSNLVANGVGAQQIAKSPDRNTAEVVKRIPGITLQDNRFIVVRGLSERYNNVWLDNALPPSSESDKRAFSFDLIPSQAVNRIMVYKTPSADMPGDFAGAFIKITTLPIPESNKTNFSYTLGYRTGTTLQPFKLAEGGKTDFLGFDDGSRSLPGSLPSRISSNGDADYYTKIGKAFDHNWKVNTNNAIPDQRFSVTNQTKIPHKKFQIGVVTGLSYSLTNQKMDIVREDFNADNTKNFHYTDNQNTQQASNALLHNWSFVFNPKHKLEFRNFLNVNGRNQTTIRTGQDFDGSYDVESGALYYMSRLLLTSQLGMTHKWNDNQTTDWTVSYSRANRSEPDFKRYRRNKALNSNDPYIMGVPISSASSTNGGRFFSKVHENLININLNHEYKFAFGNWKPSLKAGIYSEIKDRAFQARIIGYVQSSLTNFNDDILSLPVEQVFASENVYVPGGFRMDEITNPSDKYETSYMNNAGYLLAKLPIGEKFNISAGVRTEANSQKLNGTDQTGSKVNTNIQQLFVLPSVNLTYNITESHVLRAAAGKTINRPEFREIAPFIFYDFDLNSTIIGNPNLKIAEIYNADLRYEYYFKNADFISLGGFYKNFNNPIEWVVVPGTGGSLNRTFTFANAKNAQTLGIEFESRKSLNFLGDFMSRFSLVANLSLIQSTVDLGDVNTIQATKRQMQGQSPYIVNGGIFYQDSSDFQASILYNVFGPRLFVVGDRTYPDVYEMQRHVVDLSISKRFAKKYTVKLAISDILNQPWTLLQNTSGVKLPVRKTTDNVLANGRRGSYITMGINIDLSK